MTPEDKTSLTILRNSFLKGRYKSELEKLIRLERQEATEGNGAYWENLAADRLTGMTIDRDQARAELEAGLKLMREHMRQRDEMKTKLATLTAMSAKLADYLETATGIIEEDTASDEDDIADARNLISDARALAGSSL